MKVIAIIQARMGSMRLPGKSLMDIAGKPLLWYVIERVKRVGEVQEVILATSVNPENDPLCQIASECGIQVYRGSETDVLSRFVETGKKFDADVIVRICADNPLVDTGEIDRIVGIHRLNGCDYSFNHVPDGTNNYPDGLGAEVINAGVLYRISNLSLTSEEREHVTLHILKNPDTFSIQSCQAPPEIIGPDIKLDIDTPEDFSRMKGFIESLPDVRKPLWTAAEIVRGYRLFFSQKAIVLLRDAKETLFYHTTFRELHEVIIPLALTPESWWECEKNDIQCLLIQDYFDDREIYETGLKNYEKLELFCETIDSELKIRFPELQKNNINLVHNQFGQLKTIMDNFTTKIDIFQNIIKKEKPSLIILLSDQEEWDTRTDFNPGMAINYFHFIVKRERIPLHFAEIKIRSGSRKSQKYTIRKYSDVQKSFLSAPSVFELLHLVKKRGIVYGFLHLPLFLSSVLFNRDYLFFIGYGYDWSDTLEVLYRKGYSTVHLFEKKPDLCFGELELEFLQEKYCHEFMHKSIDYSQEIIMLVKTLIHGGYSVFMNNAKEIDQKIKKYRPRVIICSTKTTAFEQIAAQIAYSHNLPVISWQHGAYGMHRAPGVLHSELMNTSVHFCWGGGVKEYLEREPLNHFTCKQVMVGSLALETAYFSSGSSENKIKCFYITTGYYNESFYINAPFPFMDNSLWITQRNIINFLGESEYVSVVKLHPSLGFDRNISDYVTHQQFSNITITHEGDTIDFMNQSEIIIIDYPSTTLLQALSTKKVVFVLTSHLYLTETALELLNKRAYCFDSLEELLENLSRFCKGQSLEQTPDVNNTEYFVTYGLYLLDGHVMLRAINELEGAINRQ